MLALLRAVSFTVFFSLAALTPHPSFARSGPTGFADLAEKLLPAVVNISTTQTIMQGQGLQQFEFDFPEGSPFENFMEEFKKHQEELPPDEGREFKRKATSLGSGFIIDPKGYIVTNYHVIQDAEEITVILQDNTNLTATVLGYDKKTDLALLKVNSKIQLTAVSFGNSDKVRVGDWILTIGNPFGLGGSVTTGIISARARDINSGPYDDYLQTDAPINRGNSGGPMFNMDGEVIGVNTAIYSPTGGSVGIGFAIPSSMAQNVIEQLKTHGVTRRGWLGVRIQAVTPEIAESLGLSKPEGALVSSVTEGGPAAKAKLNVGDVIIGFDGKDIPDMHSLPRIVAETEVGKTVNVDVFRKGKKTSFTVSVGKLEQNDEEESSTHKPQSPLKLPEADKVDALGLDVTPITDKIRKKYKIGKDTNGILVMTVDTDGLAAEYGIQRGDVITEASQKEIRSAKDLLVQIHVCEKESKPLLLLVDRKGDLRFIAISLDKGKKKKRGDN